MLTEKQVGAKDGRTEKRPGADCQCREKGRGRCDVGVLRGWDQKGTNTWQYSAPEAVPQNYLDKMTEVRALTSSLEADFDRANPIDLYLETKAPISKTIPWG